MNERPKNEFVKEAIPITEEMAKKIREYIFNNIIVDEKISTGEIICLIQAFYLVAGDMIHSFNKALNVEASIPTYLDLMKEHRSSLTNAEK